MGKFTTYSPDKLRTAADRLRKSLGRRGEDIACKYLKDRDFILLERNFRCSMGEVDIIALDGEHICFVEVKARTGTSYGTPRDAVGRAKRRRLLKAAALYLKLHPELSERYSPRMDIAELIFAEGVYLRYTPSAFSS